MRQTFLTRCTGPEVVAEFFRRAFSSGRLAHAYLFVGPRGSGRKAFARTLAQALFCDPSSATAIRSDHDTSAGCDTLGLIRGSGTRDCCWAFGGVSRGNTINSAFNSSSFSPANVTFGS